MDRNAPARNAYTCTADLLTWSEKPQHESPSINIDGNAKPYTSTADLLSWSSEKPLQESSSIDSSIPILRSSIRTHQPAGGISRVQFGEQTSEEEAESVLKRKPCSGFKLREMTGSSIFAADGENGAPESGIAISTPNNKTGLKTYPQAVNAVSQISFKAGESVSPKKPTSVAEIAKQRELSGTIESKTEAKMKQSSNAKSKELSGHDIFGPPESPHRPLTARSLGLKESNDMGEPAPRNLRTSVKVSNPAGGHSNIMFCEETTVKAGKKSLQPAGGHSNIMFCEETTVKAGKKSHNPKFAELTANDIFKGEAPQRCAEKSHSTAKLREMSGSNIFADGEAPSRDHFRGARRPPGGESSISLV